MRQYRTRDPAQAGATAREYFDIRARRREAISQIADVMADDPFSVIDGVKIAALAWWRNKLVGSFLLIGMGCAPFILLGFVRGYFFPSPLSPAANTNVRVGHTAGAFVRYQVWQPAVVPAMANAEANFRVQEASYLSGGTNQQLMPLVTSVRPNQEALRGAGLSPAEVQMISTFAGE
jgi:hypothetical protein